MAKNDSIPEKNNINKNENRVIEIKLIESVKKLHTFKISTPITNSPENKHAL